jgi:hypothetical protein
VDQVTVHKYLSLLNGLQVYHAVLVGEGAVLGQDVGTAEQDVTLILV